MLYKNPSQRCILFFQPNNGFRWKSPTLLFTDSAPKRNGTNARPLAQVSTVRHRHSHSLLSYRSVVEAPPPHSVDQSFVALHVLSFLSRNRIFYQIQIYRAFLNTAGLFFIWHIICKIFRNFYSHNEPNAPLKLLTLENLKSFPSIFYRQVPKF